MDFATDAKNCGGCGKACSAAPNATAVCEGSACKLGACAAGFADCDGVAANGCEVVTTTDAQNCGACGKACGAVPSGTSACTSGQCVIQSCAAGYADCDGQVANGCESPVGTDAKNCGACGKACGDVANAAATCVMGACQATCKAGFADCDGQYANGCESDLSTVATCGGCGKVCPVPANGTAVCTAGVCGLGGCAAGFANCDNLALNGCEVDLSTDALNCGGCGKGCAAVAKGMAACVGGQCGIGQCSAGYADCDKQYASGCESESATDPKNCGGCGMACAMVANAMPSCAQGGCKAACGFGYADCDGQYVNGCEVNLTTDVKNCSACNKPCGALANATVACSGAMCVVGQCNAGFGNCDGMTANGCETPTDADTKNCGACGTLCAPQNANALCLGGQCGYGACTAGYTDCDGNKANGCEANLQTDAKNCGACGTVCGAMKPICLAGACSCTPGAFPVQRDFNANGGVDGLSVGDFNKDGKLDVAVAGFNEGGVYVMLNDGAGGLVAGVSYAAPSPQDLATADLDGDGAPDLVATNRSGGRVTVLRNLGAGTFAQSGSLVTNGSEPYGVAIADVDGDARPDILAANRNGVVSVFKNAGNGTFGAAATYPGGSGSWMLAVGDLTGDGRPDIAVSNYTANTVSVLKNLGGGVFDNPTPYAISGTAVGLAMEDLNGDGKLDIVVANAGNSIAPGFASVLLNLGAGVLGPAANYQVGVVPSRIAVGDVNLDGKPDLLVGNENGKSLSLLTNAGAGTFGAATTFANQYSRGVAIVDLDKDGFPDLVYGSGTKTVSLRRNVCQ